MGVDVCYAAGLYPVAHRVLHSLIFSLPRLCVCVCVFMCVRTHVCEELAAVCEGVRLRCKGHQVWHLPSRTLRQASGHTHSHTRALTHTHTHTHTHKSLHEASWEVKFQELTFFCCVSCFCVCFVCRWERSVVTWSPLRFPPAALKEAPSPVRPPALPSHLASPKPPPPRDPTSPSIPLDFRTGTVWKHATNHIAFN